MYAMQGRSNPYVGVPTVQLESTLTLYAMAESLLALVKQCFINAGINLPDREVIYPAPIPADCEQVAVLYNGWSEFPASEGATRSENFRWAGGFSVIVTRKTPALAPPSSKNPTPTPDAMKAAALVASQDAEVMLAVVRALDEFSEVSVIVQSPAGGLQTVELNVTIPAAGGGL